MRKTEYKNWIILALVLILAILIVYRSTDECETCLVEPDESFGRMEDISATEANIMIHNRTGDPDFVLLDIRTPAEFASGHIEGALNLDFYSDTFRKDLDSLDKDKTYLIYCRTASRTGKAIEIMNELNFAEVYNMVGGIVQWQADGFPIVTGE